MGYPKPKNTPQQEQEQEQEQAQLAVQSLDSKSDNKNSNDNNNQNSNDNKNSNENNLDNKVNNKTDNSTDNNVDNKLNNSVDNKVENTVDNKVNVDVNVDLNLQANGLSSPVIDLHGINTTDSLVMPEVVNQTINGGGNAFHLDQVNYLLNDATVTDPNVTFNGSSSYEQPGSGFSMDAKISGGDSKIGDAKMGDTAGAGAGIVSHADSTLTQDAFTQTITTGANIQFNSNTLQVAGHDLTDDHHVL